MSPLSHQVSQFMSAFGQDMPPVPTVPNDDIVRLRLRLVAEEFFELLDACLDDSDVGWRENLAAASERVDALICCLPILVDLPEVADALGDLDYVNEGMRLAFGIDGVPVANAIHKSNMAKTNGPVVNGKQLKPDGWKPPDIVSELRGQGWRG